jgi:hypothetical protein
MLIMINTIMPGGIFYNVFKCFAKTVTLDNEQYHKILDFIFTTNGFYLGTYNGPNSAESVNTQELHPDMICCCCCYQCDCCPSDLNDDT